MSHRKPLPGAIELSIVIPFFNEEDCMVPVCMEVHRVLAASFAGSWEIIMIDDGSTDRLHVLTTRFTHFRVVRLAANSQKFVRLAFEVSPDEFTGTTPVSSVVNFFP